MSKYLAYYRNAVRAALSDNDETDYLWTDEELDQHILHAVRDVSMLKPAEKMAAFGLAADSKEVDISSLEDLIDVDRVEFKPEQSTRQFRNWKEVYNGKLYIDTDETIVATATGTLTGTVTFARGSTTVTGSGTAFTTELEVDDWIKMSTGNQYYRVTAIATATSLTIGWKSVDNGADTVSATVYCDDDGTGKGDPVYVYYLAMHDLDSDSSTIPDYLSQTVIDGGVAYTALAWVAEGPEKIQDAIDKFADAETALDNTSARITQAIADIDSGRTVVAAVLASADTSIGNSATPLTNAATALSSGSSAIGAELANADTAIDTAITELGQAVTDLDSGRSEIGAELTNADSAIDNMTARIEGAVSYLETGDDYINTVNKGANVPDKYLGMARGELSNALSYLNQAKGYLAEDQVATEYARYATADMNNAIGYLQAARMFLAEDQLSGEYAQNAAGDINLALGHLRQASSYLQRGQAASMEYSRLASAELGTSSIYFNEAKSHLSIVNSKLNVASLIGSFQTWANARYAMYQEALKTRTQRSFRTRKMYAR
jgi:flagellin-like hook-associated protein FlgL